MLGVRCGQGVSEAPAAEAGRCAWSGGGHEAFGRVLSTVYDDLRAIASAQLRRERPGHTLQTTALVHEAYMRLAGQRTLRCEDRSQFFGAAAGAMRRVLVDHARSRSAGKRRPPGSRMPLDEALACLESSAIDLLTLDELLEGLRRLDERKAVLVELRFFAGLTLGEAAEVMGVPRRTAERDWTFARAWLRSGLDGVATG